MGRRVGKWVVGKERERATIVVQKFPDEMQRPGIFGGRRHGGEPDLPIDPALIRSDDRGTPVGIARFGFEFVLFPLRVAGNQRVIGSLKNNFGALMADGAKCAVRIYEVKRIIRVIHQLPPGNQIQDRSDAQIDNAMAIVLLMRDGSDCWAACSARLTSRAGRTWRRNVSSKQARNGMIVT